MIAPGKYSLPFNLENLREIVYRDLSNSDLQEKIRPSGIFKKPSKELKDICKKIILNYDDELEYVFEIFRSTSPVKLHNDANYADDVGQCKRIVIIPIDYSPSFIPSTIVFDKSYHEKIVAGKEIGSFVNLSDEKINLDIENKMFINDDYYQEKLCQMNKNYYTGLKIKEEHAWSLNSFFAIDSSYLHTASYFDKTKWKLSLNGLGFSKKI